MGIFSFLFGGGTKYSQQEYPITKLEIERLVSHEHVSSLSQSQEHMVEQLITERRRGDGKISLRQIDELLRKLKYQNKISVTDQKGILRVFDNFFKNKFGS